MRLRELEYKVKTSNEDARPDISTQLIRQPLIDIKFARAVCLRTPDELPSMNEVNFLSHDIIICPLFPFFLACGSFCFSHGIESDPVRNFGRLT
jgi:hypothetical protein